MEEVVGGGEQVAREQRQEAGELVGRVDLLRGLAAFLAIELRDRF